MAAFGQPQQTLLRVDIIGYGDMRVIVGGFEQQHLLFVISIQQQQAAWTVSEMYHHFQFPRAWHATSKLEKNNLNPYCSLTKPDDFLLSRPFLAHCSRENVFVLSIVFCSSNMIKPPFCLAAPLATCQNANEVQ
jgi:hypothetical protein